MTIVSGGQTGADRAALDFAIARGFPHGGWCPLGRRAEDGVIPPRYSLRETEGTEYGDRTSRNVADSDATVIFSRERKIRGGTALTARVAIELEKPLLRLTAATPVAEAAEKLRRFLSAHKVRVLNVAGPRASQEPAIRAFVSEVLAGALDSDVTGVEPTWAD